jgi:NAD(P)-dependent dehydrogenase (short-subunit alcohol dehydrogenase family)
VKLSDTIAVIAGGVKGVGEAISLAFAREGADIVMADIDEKTALTTIVGGGIQ